MNYELAQQLKDSGFPRESFGIGDKIYDQDLQTLERFVRPVEERDLSGNFFEILKTKVFIPTIGELIDAMPMRRKDLGTINDAHFVLRKLVSGDNNSYWAYMEDEDIGQEIEGYSFRNEPADTVVARLWLALNKK